MHKRSKKPVWLLFKLLETILSSICCYVHIKCFESDGVPDIFILCATYGSGCVIGILGILCSFFTLKLNLTTEAITSGVLGSLHLFTVYAHMYLAEHDKLLAFFKDHEKDSYGFLCCCQTNATLSLYAVAVYYLHCNFALDMLLTHSPTKADIVKHPLKLYFISKGVEHYLRRFRWFQYLSVGVVMGSTKRQSFFG
ncbi:uncharacterized protein LOC6559580 [Drosophila grimshawi]|uniref:GH21210 n=1 Tax=Drosophila grimshawi TaxID=7222 RepID=B4J753_DROGR|nr:uncharacterized protein LOC6559580 [Drosophila grimshawi]EDW01041.1 GH21210 [Drosophila grimshawi]